MTVVGRMPGGFILVEETVAGPGSYATGTPPVVNMLDLSQGIERVISVHMAGGREASLASFAGRAVTVRVRGDANPVPATTGAVFVEVPDGTDISGATENITVLAYGR